MRQQVKVGFGEILIFFKECSITKQTYSVEVFRDAYQKWKEGALIQDVMPDLSDEEREFLISESTPAEFARLFPEH